MGLFSSSKQGKADAAEDHGGGDFGGGKPTPKRGRVEQKTYDRSYRKTYDKAVNKARRER